MINEFRPMNHLTSLQNLICTIGNLPTSYALSLSYEEQIWWLCDFLEKKVFPAIEENTNITEETQQAFIELQNYVRDYFNNLDVQEEINNKLDEMLESGELERIIINYFEKLQVTYEQFGAVGDGITDDYQSIYNTHIYANEHNLKVVAEPEKIYYIKNITNPIPIKTNVDFNNSTFIIDDTDNDLNNVHLFEIISDNSWENVLLGSINKQTKKIDILSNIYNCNMLLALTDATTKQFIRVGANADEGHDKFDIVRVGSDGKVLDKLMWDFDTVTNARIKLLNDKPITIENGNFKTLCNIQNSNYNYVLRNIYVSRSNCSLNNIVHTIENEPVGINGSNPYIGFINIEYATNVSVNNCIVTAHKIYKNTLDGTNMGNYDIVVNRSIDIKFNNVNQSNSILDSNLWGVHTSNYSKKIYFNNCTLNRIDAHRGIQDLFIDNCNLGVYSISVVGVGYLTVNNTFINSNTIINLRQDYGCFWNGFIILKNIKWNSIDNETVKTIVSARFNPGHDFGYTCYLPQLNCENIQLFDNGNENDVANYVFYISGDINSSSLSDEYYPLFGNEIILKNIKSTSNKNGFIIFGRTRYVNLKAREYSKIESNPYISNYSRKIKTKIKTNCNIYIDNVDFKHSNDEINNFLTPYLTANDVGNLYSNSSLRLLPNVYIKNCKNLINFGKYITGNFIFENCEFDEFRLLTSSISLFTFNNCKFNCYNYYKKLQDLGYEITYETINKTMFDFPNNKCILNNCFFDDLKNFNDLVSTENKVNLYRTIFNFLTRIGVIENGKFYRNTFNFNNVVLSDLIEELLELNQYNLLPYFTNDALNLSNFNENISLIPRKQGTTTRRPENITINEPDGTSVNINLPSGLLYYNTSLSKIDYWNGTEWL